MTTLRRTVWLGAALVLLILVLDQALKFWVKTHMHIGEEIPLIGSWAKLYFVENVGIAFGIKPGNSVLKIVLSVMRILMVGGFCYLAHYLVRRPTVPRGVYFALLAVIAGALGNVIDGTFYGLLFSSSDGTMIVEDSVVPAVATFLPEGGGYAPLLQGKVVDMFYFPIIEFYWPDWMPSLAGQHFEFFRPVFNLADAAITASIFYLILFQRKFLFGISANFKSKKH